MGTTSSLHLPSNESSVIVPLCTLVVITLLSSSPLVLEANGSEIAPPVSAVTYSE